MGIDYEAIRRENERRYGTDIGRYGPMLLADRYADRTHFILELLQNAEDALAKRSGWDGKRSVRFHLSGRELRVSHFGKVFDEADVRGICGIAENSKKLTDIGRFGIGFKSVYAFTDRPEVHSGNEDFAIKSFVWPVAAAPIPHDPEETLMIIPLREPMDADEISAGMLRLGSGALMFLREVEEIQWDVHNGPSGRYRRARPEYLGDHVRRIIVVGEASGQQDTYETWLLFSKPVFTCDNKSAGHVEIAFSLTKDDKLGREKVRPVSPSPLAVYFPTVVETHLGFLLQGPYRTTPSRDNVPSRDQWNQQCVAETASLLVGALRWLRDSGLLDVEMLCCLPLDRAKFGEGSMFEPIFKAVRHALSTEQLLPRDGRGYIAALRSRLARSQELRKLFKPSQLAALFRVRGNLAWLSSDISEDRTSDLRNYLMRELEIEEVRPETLCSWLTAEFLEKQSDNWIRRLYEFLNDQQALRWRMAMLPLVRLADGTQVQALKDGQSQAFLPGPDETEFPTVRRSVCRTEGARAFLRGLGLTEPNNVDDVVGNILPKYREWDGEIAEETYEADLRRILAAYSTDSKDQSAKLLAALRITPFVMAVDAGDGTECKSTPSSVYLATDRFKRLFAGVCGVRLVNDRYPSLQGVSMQKLLRTCGALPYLRPVEDNSLTWRDLRELRAQAGHEKTSRRNDRITDWTLHGLRGLLDSLPSSEQCLTKAKLLWEELAHVEQQCGKDIFTGHYNWSYYGEFSNTFDAAFVRLLNETEWVPDGDGNLRQPRTVLFGSLGWKPNPFLLSKIHFKPPIIDQLAEKAGFEPGVLDLLKRRGITSEAQLRELLGVEDEPPDTGGEPGDIGGAVKSLLGDAPAPTPPVPDPGIVDPAPVGGGSGGGGGGARDRPGTGVGGVRNGGADTPGGKRREGLEKGAGPTEGKRTPGGTGGRPFISYVAVHADEEAPDPDRLDQTARMALEARAIEFILEREPEWQRTPAFNPGYDLFRAGLNGEPSRWCEVKAMTGGLGDRPVGLSRAQFDCAREHGGAYWLYVVEKAGTSHARIVRIQDPAGKARTFTFDRGWLDIAAVDAEQENREE